MSKALRWSICAGVLLLSTCSFERILTSTPAASPPLPSDEVSYLPRPVADSFEFKTLLPVDVNLDVRQYRLDSAENGPGTWTLLDPLAADVFVSVADRQGGPVYAGHVLPDGTLSTRLMLPAAPEDLTFTLTSEGFVERRFTVEAASGYAVLGRTVSMQADAPDARGVQAPAAPLPDRDADTVPDVYDAFPDDPESAFAINVPFDGPLTIAFEDLYGRAQAGDADYNDFIASYRITEIANGQDNAIVRVDGTATSEAKVSGYNHSFSIAIDSFTGNADLTIQYPARKITTRVRAPAVIPLFLSTRDSVGEQVSFSLHFDAPQPRDSMDEPPYNPFLHVWNTLYDIHLIGEQALPGSRSYGRSFQDAEGFPWALLVPSTWQHPLECQRIEVPYPRFTLWRQSFGAEHTDWYLHRDDPYVPPAATLHAYVAGYFESGTRDVAAQWKADLLTGAAPELTTLSDPASNARSMAVFVSGTGVYAAGYYATTKGDTAVYWKNGSPTTLPSEQAGTVNARASAVYASGTVVYVAGYLANKPGYWKDGTWVPLEPSLAGEATDIVVSGSDVYASGYVVNGGKENACVWKNGVRTSLYTTDYSRGNAIAVTGSDVYVAGYFLESLTLNACYWKNGAMVPLATGGAQARDVVVSGGFVYVAGYCNNTDAKSMACYWKDGVLTSLYTDPVNQGRAYGVWVQGADVYAAGYVNEGTQVACYWKNGTRTDLATSTSVAFSIAVAE